MRVKEIASIELTERDGQILREVYKHRFLRSTHIAELLGGSFQPLQRRLQLLYHHGFLDRPRCQIDYYHRGGSKPMVYGIGKRGITFLKARRLTSPNSAGRFSSSSVTRLFLEHALHTSDVLVALESACRTQSGMRYICADELLKSSSAARSFHWEVQLSASKIGVVPDAVFALERNGKRVCYFLEADRGTMPVERRTLERSSFTRKLQAYHATWKQQVHRAKFGWERFRVLTITAGPERATHLAKACAKLPSGRGLFLFQELNALLSGPDLLSLPFQTALSEKSSTLLG
jgi:hypothetical protein